LRKKFKPGISWRLAISYLIALICYCFCQVFSKYFFPPQYFFTIQKKIPFFSPQWMMTSLGNWKIIDNNLIPNYDANLIFFIHT
jgi:hypothetical protein